MLGDKARVALLQESCRSPEPARRAAAILLVEIISEKKTKGDFARGLEIAAAAQRADVVEELHRLVKQYGLEALFGRTLPRGSRDSAGVV